MSCTLSNGPMGSSLVFGTGRGFNGEPQLNHALWLDKVLWLDRVDVIEDHLQLLVKDHNRLVHGCLLGELVDQILPGNVQGKVQGIEVRK